MKNFIKKIKNYFKESIFLKTLKKYDNIEIKTDGDDYAERLPNDTTVDCGEY